MNYNIEKTKFISCDIVCASCKVIYNRIPTIHNAKPFEQVGFRPGCCCCDLFLSLNLFIDNGFDRTKSTFAGLLVHLQFVMLSGYC